MKVSSLTESYIYKEVDNIDCFNELKTLQFWIKLTNFLKLVKIFIKNQMSHFLVQKKYNTLGTISLEVNIMQNWIFK